MRNPDLEDRITKGLRFGYWHDRKLANAVRYHLNGNDVNVDWTALRKVTEAQLYNFESSVMLRFLIFIILTPVVSALCAFLSTISIFAGAFGIALLATAVINAWLSLRYVWYDYDKEHFGFFTNWHKLLLQYVKGGEMLADD